MRQRAETGASWELAEKKTVANNKVGGEAELLHAQGATLCNLPTNTDLSSGQIFLKRRNS